MAPALFFDYKTLVNGFLDLGLDYWEQSSQGLVYRLGVASSGKFFSLVLALVK